MDDNKNPSEPQNEFDQNADRPYIEEKEEFVTSRGEPTTLESPSAERPASMVMSKKQSGARKWLLWGFVALLLAGLGAFAYWQWAEAETAKQELSSAQSELQTVKASAHKTTDAEMDDEPVTNTPDDKELATLEAEAYLAALQDNKLEVLETEVEDTFAVVTAGLPNSDAPGKTIVLEKAADTWVVIYSGEAGNTPAADKTKLTTEFGVPVTLLD